MRKKSITVFLCVYAALCISYCVVSSAMVPGDNDFIAGAADIQTEESSSFENNYLSSKKGTSSESNNTESYDISSGNEISVPATEESNENKTVLSESEENNETPLQDNTETEDSIEPSEEIIQEYDDGQQYEEEIEEESEDEIVEEKLSLEEFLRGLRCSGCRHNCTLLSPRCMNGSRKASRAESQYYEIYGE